MRDSRPGLKRGFKATGPDELIRGGSAERAAAGRRRVLSCSRSLAGLEKAVPWRPEERPVAQGGS